MENTDEATLKKIRKGGTKKSDREAIRLLRQHGILSLATWVTDFEEVTDRDFINFLRQLLLYDPDQIMTLYVTPHRWTGYYRIAAERKVIQLDRRKWDYKHQVWLGRGSCFQLTPPIRTVLVSFPTHGYSNVSTFCH